ncbi:Zinc finger BED domain-containing protein DAYSLEEPER [Zea mays]|uniref:Zinc finger BED domain-containing protein DAYSLEEPER n=1 Tax=Zea mays TaxID=4577 RepID=A0A1D6M6J1_MAIZE|nr:Zinc finger BED domain-containing protein DAYSLEEPER [Zea mays]
MSPFIVASFKLDHRLFSLLLVYVSCQKDYCSLRIFNRCFLLFSRDLNVYRPKLLLCMQVCNYVFVCH